MAQIAIIPSTASQAPISGPPASGDESPFSPHLENAIAEQKPGKNSHSSSDPTQAQSEAHKLSSRQGDPIPGKFEGENEPILTESLFPSAITEPILHQTLKMATLSQDHLSPDNSPSLTQQVTLNASHSTVSPLEESVVITAVPKGIKGAGDKLIDIFAGNTGVVPGKFAQKSADNPAFSQIEFTVPAEVIKPDSLTPGSPIAGVRSDSGPLLARLQEIITNSSETGRVSIKGSGSTGFFATAISEQPAVTGVSSVAEEMVQTAPKFSDQQLPSLRQNVQQQYYAAKVNSDSISGDSSNSQGNAQNNTQSGDPGTQGSTLPQTNSSLSGIDQSATFQQTASLVQQTASQISSESAKPILLPSGTIVPEENVVQQFMERFQLARRIAESKINIKLHPAELGELKIDLSVKEGSIKANVVAQTQQVQEVIERNIAKLRSVLEEQGYNLEAVTVTTESDSVGDFDLFERQLFSQQDQTLPNTRDQQNAAGFFDQEIIFMDETTDNNGVNVRV